MIGDELAKRRLGEVLDGRYELAGLLGVGMTGAVYRAVHKYTQREVAVKVMHRLLLDNEDAVTRFLREAKSVAKIGHPAIVDVFDAGETSDRWPYLVLELLRGRSLSRAMNEAKLGHDAIVRIGVELLDGLAAAHAEGIVHRDLKPDNIFLLDAPDRGTTVKILDFGLAKNLNSSGVSGVLTQPGSTIGTPSYMSPEQARAELVDGRTDLWSAGAVLFHAAAGRPPFVRSTLPALLFELVTQDAPALREHCPDAPAPLQRAVDGALVRDPARRWPNAAAMAAALRGE